MQDANHIAAAYIALWNETDAQNRQALMERDWTRDASYRDPLMAGSGPAEISGLVAAVHDRFPGFVFGLSGAADGFGDQVRFSWGLGPKGAEPLIRGTDFVTVRDGLIATVTGFLDQVPDAA
ncbi:SnoaL-like protein [Hoeflea marina]|uniref:SnoaL-like protein n=1 Tax=Hoeflea marina TaxID=274592 RepID=A0A317PPM9_9HYPH|nr:nuclear transport factor 2 family protein [Hoeflea marina]PWW03412.1 SnoaL-like protein [Hoeflea marina]